VEELPEIKTTARADLLAPLLQAMRTNGISKEEIDRIEATGYTATVSAFDLVRFVNAQTNFNIAVVDCLIAMMSDQEDRVAYIRRAFEENRKVAEAKRLLLEGHLELLHFESDALKERIFGADV